MIFYILFLFTAYSLQLTAFMRIGVDIRPLLEPYMSGVGEYTYKVLKRILEIDYESQYHLFYNIRHSVKTTPPVFDYPNAKTFGYEYPNRWLNLSMRFFGWPRIEKLMGLHGGTSLPPYTPPLAGGDISYHGQPDVMWFPNFGFMNFNTRVPYVLTVHDLSFERYPEFFTPAHRLWHKLIDCKRMARGAHRIIAVSENTKEDLIDLYNIDSQKIVVIHEGVGEEYVMRNSEDIEIKKLRNLEIKDDEDDGLNEVKEKYNLPDKFILFLGTIEPRKNIEAIIRAFDKYTNLYANKSEFLGEYRRIELVLAGGPGWRNEEIYEVYKQAKNKDRIKFIGYVDREDKSALYSLASLFVFPSIYEVYKQAKNKDRIKFIGYVDKEDKPALYSLASLFVFPSIYEGFGLPPLEAMAGGTPVIASNASSLPEVVGEAGLLVDPYNVNELAEAMRVMLSDEKLREDFVERGREQVKKFSWDVCARKMLEVIKEVGGLA